MYILSILLQSGTKTSFESSALKNLSISLKNTAKCIALDVVVMICLETYFEKEAYVVVLVVNVFFTFENRLFTSLKLVRFTMKTMLHESFLYTKLLLIALLLWRCICCKLQICRHSTHSMIQHKIEQSCNCLWQSTLSMQANNCGRVVFLHP